MKRITIFSWKWAAFFLLLNSSVIYSDSDNPIFTDQLQKSKQKCAIVTLVTGTSPNVLGYVQGALALAQSLINVNSTLTRVVMVTPEVPKDMLDILQLFYTLHPIKPIECHIKLPYPHDQKFPIQVGENQFTSGFSSSYFENAKRWKYTCTKFMAWNLTEFETVIFMDSDTIVINPIDNIFNIYKTTTASYNSKSSSTTTTTLFAAPEVFPTDTFNAGFMIIKPNAVIFELILRLNVEVGSVEGHDQGVLNRALCPLWHSGHPTTFSLDKQIVKAGSSSSSSRSDSVTIHCGKLPFSYNIPANLYDEYSQRPLYDNLMPHQSYVIHYLSSSDSKPWMVLHYENIDRIKGENKNLLIKQRNAQLLWREAYFKASGQTPPPYSIFN